MGGGDSEYLCQFTRAKIKEGWATFRLASPGWIILIGITLGVISVAIGNLGTAMMVVALMVIAFLAGVIVRQYKNRDVLEIGPVIMVSYLLYSLAYPLYMSRGAWTVLLGYTRYLGITFVGFLGLILGYCLAVRAVHWKTSLPSLNDQDIKGGTWLLGLISLASLATLFRAFGGVSGFLNIGYGGDYWKVILEGQILGSGLEWFGLAMILGFIFTNKPSTRIVTLSLLVAWAFFNFAVGGRGRVIHASIIFFILWWYLPVLRKEPSVHKMRLVFFWLLILAGYVFAQYIGISREFLHYGMGRAAVKGAAAIWSNPELLLPWESGEFIRPGGALQELLTHGAEWNPWLGKTYLEALVFIVPGLGRLFDLNYVPLSIWRMQTFYPVQWAQGRGFGFSAAAEGFANFGVAGVFLHLFVLGGLCGIPLLFGQATQK